MAIINKTGITDGSTIQAEHVTRAIDALSGGSTDSIVATGSFSGSLTGTATSASFATTASFALNAGAGVGFPYTGSAIISGSLSITGTSTFTTNNVNIGFGTVAITADADSTIDLSAAGANSGGGLVIPTGSITEAQEGSMYFDANETRLYIYDGSEWRFVTLT
jgi:hypothetical protein